MPAIAGTALLLIVGCGLAWSALDVLRKLLAPHLSPLAVVFFLALGQVPVLAAWGAGQPAGAATGRYVLVAASSIALNVLANVAFVSALARSRLSLVVPLLSLTPAFVAAFARPLLGETPRPGQLLGIAVVVVGALLLGGAAAERDSLAAWWRALRGEAGTVLMLVVAVCWGLTLPLDKLGVGAVGPARHALVLSAGVALATLLLMLAMGLRRGDLAAVWRGGGEAGQARWGLLPTLALGVLVSALALALQLLAIRAVLVGIVEAVKRAIGNLMSLLLGLVLFGERVGWRHVGALMALVAGVALILLT
jgi:drug/metabolite transporter (DMT)-like permease